MQSGSEIEEIPILIVGAGPVGLTLSIDLTRFGVRHIVVGEGMTTASHPRANAINARSMEHFRRLGIADTLRQQGLPLDHPWDIVYLTRLAGREITRLKIPSRGEVAEAQKTGNPFGWPTPEYFHRLSQIFIERILHAKASDSEFADVRLGQKVQGLIERDDHVEVEVADVKTGQVRAIRARWVVGCDGARSFVRDAIGARFEGERATREYYGGSTVAVYFESQQLQQILADRRALLYQTFNPDMRAGGFAINGTDRFVFHFQAPNGTDPDKLDVAPYLATIVGHELDFTILSRLTWSAGLALVVDKQATHRVFLAGDAAHLFTPTGGFGMNTGLDEAANIAWKLAGVELGWGGPELLASYAIERRPIAHRNVKAAARIADLLVGVKIPSAIEADGPEGEHARAEAAASIQRVLNEEVNTKGVQLGVRYEGSPIVIPDGTPETPDSPTVYIPSARPGSRLPHVTLDEGPVYDKLCAGFTLLCIDRTPDEIGEPMDLSGIDAPLSVVDIGGEGLMDIYAGRYILVRPDQHVAWRGCDRPDDLARIVRIACGHEQ